MSHLITSALNFLKIPFPFRGKIKSPASFLSSSSKVLSSTHSAPVPLAILPFLWSTWRTQARMILFLCPWNIFALNIHMASSFIFFKWCHHRRAFLNHLNKINLTSLSALFIFIALILTRYDIFIWWVLSSPTRC